MGRQEQYTPESKVKVLADILNGFSKNIKLILIIGCGNGNEAIILSDYFKAEVIGIDIEPKDFIKVNNKNILLKQGNAESLEFLNNQFDLIFSFHVLEHVSNWKLVLKEINRCLKPDGFCIIGTPNINRLIGYLGLKTNIKYKILTNFRDWKYKLKGKFRNEYGAHAGYSRKELYKMMEESFSNVIDITNDYYCKLYPNHIGKIHFLLKTKIDKYFLPSVYFIGFKKDHNVKK